jgi:hypothetical protein
MMINKLFTRPMFIRASALAGALAVAMVAGGCQLNRNSPEAALDPTPIPVDSAMAQRNWEQSSAVYARAGVMAWPTLETFKSDEYRYSWATALTETPLFLANIALSPYAAYQTPPWRMIEHRAETVPPSYSAMPPLPGSPSNTPAPVPWTS